MKSKLLFTAALMSAMAGTAQVTWVDVRGVNGVEDSWAMPMDEGTELPEPWQRDKAGILNGQCNGTMFGL